MRASKRVWLLAFLGAAACEKQQPVPEVPTFDLVEIPAGNVKAGAISCESDRRLEDDTHALGSFAIDKQPITCAQYRACVRAKACKPWRAEGICYGNDSPELARPNLLYVARELAEDFCRWRGLQLPTLLQWQRAVRGPHGAKYPPGEDGTHGIHLNCARSYPHPSGQGCEYTSQDGVIYRIESGAEHLRRRHCNEPPGEFERFDRVGVILYLAASVATSRDDAGSQRSFRCVREPGA